ncbi:MAG TPA: phosphate ABC transporter substrate-binding protein [Firmicutes bacterium]|nr:phosphate ABC transporter substrate-binding protein [Bacillota bacterium]
MKKLLSLLSAMALVATMAACSSETPETDSNTDNSNGDTTSETTELGAIDVVSREEGSGTRGAFEEIIGFNIEKDGEVADPMRSDVTIKDGNGVVATYVEGNEAALGYVSFTTLEEKANTLKGLKVGGVEPTSENVLNGTYGVARPFVLVYKEDVVTDVEKAFIEFLASKDGLEILEEAGTIVDLDGAADFDASKYADLTGKMVLGGSTSTEKAVKAAAEEFAALIPGVEYGYEATGSGTGIKNAAAGTYTLGFASREVKESEITELGITDLTMCMDGIALVINPANEALDITLEQIKEIYTGELNDWSEVK